MDNISVTFKRQIEVQHLNNVYIDHIRRGRYCGPFVLAYKGGYLISYIIHCDGAAAPTNPGPSSFGATIHSSEGSYYELSDFLGHGTNQTAELWAAIHSLRSLPAGAKVLLVSDSQYVLKGLTEWRKGWIARGWKNAQKKPIANIDIWKALFVEYDSREVDVKWVRGHTGHEHNERADALATAVLIAQGVISSEEEQPGFVAEVKE